MLAGLRSVLQAHAEVRLALVFGSRARGDARPDSDLDVAVLAPGMDLLALAATLRDATGLEVDVVSLSDVTIPLLQELVRDSVVVHEGAPGEGATWRHAAMLALATDLPWYRRMRDAFVARLASSGGFGEARN